MRFLPVVWLLACGAQPQDGAPCERAWWYDSDGDGFGGRSDVWMGCEAPPHYVEGPEDCRDDDPLAFPGADERCNQLDDDCDDKVDEQAVDPSPFHRDLDGDGYGDPDDQVDACEAPEGYVDNADDCNDGAAQTNPGAEELCDDADRDCDGHPTNGAVDGVEWFEDGDGDGFGGAASEWLCDPDPSGWAPASDDCDDSDPSSYPGAPEGIADGVDSDCDGAEDCPADRDGDGFGGDEVLAGDLACSLPGLTSTLGDCDDTDDAVNPTATELPFNGRDDDCDPVTLDDDGDRDGWGLDQDCDDTDPLVNDGIPLMPVFADISSDAGVSILQWDTVLQPPRCSKGEEWMGSGVAIADFDADGLMDVFLPRIYDSDQLLQQQADGSFIDVGASAGVDWAGGSNGAVWFDADADLDLDLYVVMLDDAENRLYINDGSGVFTEEAVTRGAAIPLSVAGECSITYSVSAGDLDNDGDIDLITNAWQFSDFPGIDRSQVLLNDGAGFFVEDGLSVGVDLTFKAGFTTAILDVDDDGDRDLALAADYLTSTLWSWEPGGFVDVTGTAGVGTDENGMGADWADVDLDGDLDWFVTSVWDPSACGTNWGCTGNRLYLNQGGLNFTDGTDAAGVREGDWGWGTVFADLDHDGDQDLVQQNGMPHEGFEQDIMRVFMNDGSGVFEEAACDRRLDIPGQGRAAQAADFDGDGDLDLFLTFAGEAPRLMRNDGGESLGEWLRISLLDAGSLNPYGLGSTVRVIPVSGPVQRRAIHANSTFVGTGPAEAHFGLGGETVVDVEVTWPDGAVQVESGVATGQVLEVVRSVP